MKRNTRSTWNPLALEFHASTCAFGYWYLTTPSPHTGYQRWRDAGSQLSASTEMKICPALRHQCWLPAMLQHSPSTCASASFLSRLHDLSWICYSCFFFLLNKKMIVLHISQCTLHRISSKPIHSCSFPSFMLSRHSCSPIRHKTQEHNTFCMKNI